ncbi:hypothetical protein [Halalkalibacter akibai]|uniref:Uncharacterized protein n=1 Tax=Halalkalibacter akibai (strain ATCC 43226 / DSM 21942 / CIP 109018 / JCM 9157 / 1139) TaxID=1236973 RepID=W4QZH9_HALA3|nr:hypothetical protein [Halalkalibacter akibai]GAE37471.1 hypothetical protein JCM9157_4773 [Halalkalibacter akibai JCM 9157]
MKRKLLVVLLFAGLGSSMVSSMDSLSYTFKSTYYVVSATLFFIFAILSFYLYKVRTVF